MMRLTAIALVSLLAACATAPAYVPAGVAGPVAPAQVKVGDYWEYAVRDGYTGTGRGLQRFEVSAVDANRVVVDVTHNGRRVDAVVYAAGWNGLELPLTNLQRFHYEPALPAYTYPLEPGRSWYTIVNATDPVTRKTYRVHTQGKVVGWERIQVPAGEFDALKIQRYVFAGNPDAVKSQESIAETDWYVPALRRAARTHASSEHFDNSTGGGDEGGDYPSRVRGEWLIAELVRYSP